MNEPVIIIGGGVAGITCAVALSEAGQKVVLLERDAWLGGRACSVMDTQTRDVVDIGPHVFTSEHRNMLALLERFGTHEDICWQPERFITLVDNGRALPMRNHALPAPLHFLPNFLRVNRLSLSDTYSARHVLLRVMSLSEDDVLRYDERNALEVLQSFGVSKPFIDWFWRTVCMAILNVPLERCSAGSLLRFLRIMASRNDFHFGFPTRGLGELFASPARAVIEKNGGEIWQESCVENLLVEDRALRGVLLADGRSLETRHCVSTVPPQALLRLLPPQTVAAHPEFQSLTDYVPSPYVSTYLWFSQKLTQERFWARVWMPDNLNYDFYDLSNIRPSWSGRGSLIATNIIGNEKVAHWDDESVIAATLDELAEFAPEATDANLRHARVHRIPMAIPAPEPGFERRRPAVRSPLNGLYLAGDWTATAVPASMESAARSGWLAAEAAGRDRGCPLRLALPLRPMQGVTAWWWRQRNHRGQD